ncbi:matrix metalloproteinase-21-like [Acipenser oxyrinchus oxyrinchus]|uniref:Matrix metalloproteinase-21-like n=1 Tax=Acipenser oxyrinchus oxyrinchus TaxID=40147 RepID=A0AAD8G173_ACIOX|nr:matrix metalloproteinase-21-like [Acipenser oxyrinchus oxyrinchus]
MEPFPYRNTVAFLALFLCLTVRHAGAEKLFHSRDHSDIQDLPSRQAQLIQSPEAAQEFLTKYGYVDPVGWEDFDSENVPMPIDENQAPKELIFEGEPPSRFGEDIEQKPTESPAYIESLKSFQRDNGIPVTGVLDEQTKEVMNRPRCGVPDHKASSNETASNETSTVSQTNSTGEFTSNDTETAPIREKRFLSRLVEHVRRKRADVYTLAGDSRTSQAFSKSTLKWRLMEEGYSMHLSIEQQKSVLRLAFRMWSEVIPVQFVEDLTSSSSEIDIKLGFGTARHLGCSQVFDGVGQEFAHAWYLGDIHFDDDEHFVGTNSDQGISLLKVAVHEIGHALGLPHKYRTGSVMQPNYIPQDNNVEIDWLDRKEMQALYGICQGPFNSVFDWVRREKSATGDWIYRFNTYFFRSSWYWMYENRSNRTRYGDPFPVNIGWRGIPSSDIDAFIHVWTWNINAQYFFKGTLYWRYDPDNDMIFTEDPEGVRYPKLISEGFPGAPSPIDTAFFDKRDRNIYFFRGSQVTAFSVDLKQKVSGYPKQIVDVFPATTPGDHPIGNIDAVYYSYTTNSIYFIKDTLYWKVITDKDRIRNPSYPYNGLLQQNKVSNSWFDICDVHNSVLLIGSK